MISSSHLAIYLSLKISLHDKRAREARVVCQSHLASSEFLFFWILRQNLRNRVHTPSNSCQPLGCTSQVCLCVSIHHPDCNPNLEHGVCTVLTRCNKINCKIGKRIGSFHKCTSWLAIHRLSVLYFWKCTKTKRTQNTRVNFSSDSSLLNCAAAIYLSKCFVRFASAVNCREVQEVKSTKFFCWGTVGGWSRRKLTVSTPKCDLGRD